MADRGLPGKPVDCRRVRKMIAHQSEPSLGVKSRALKGDNACCFLAPVLKGVQPERCDRGRVRVAEDPEDAAFFAQPVFIETAAERLVSKVGMEVDGVLARFAQNLGLEPINVWEPRQGQPARAPARSC